MAKWQCCGHAAARFGEEHGGVMNATKSCLLALGACLAVAVSAQEEGEEIHAAGALGIAEASGQERRTVALSHLGAKEKAFLAHLEAEDIRRFAPSERAKALGVTNRTIINWCAGLVRAGFLRPETGGTRIRFYVRTEP